jgi:protein-ribulosamine 3-kinase
MLPARLRASVEARLGPVRRAEPVGGGCINHAARLDTAAGPVFLKHNAAAPPGLFAAEADGLRALRAAAAGHLRVPEVLAVHDVESGARGSDDSDSGDSALGDRSSDASDSDDGAPAWIALEWLDPAPRARDFSERLGRGLAHLHHARPNGRWGWERANFIGSLPQSNDPPSSDPSTTWAGFWRDRRLAPQLDLARASGRLPASEREWERLFDRLPDLLSAGDDDGPSLVHGDLWSGNVVSAAGEPGIVDPAVYRGHREVDLAMAELFGGFDAPFFAAYREAWPQAPGYREVRRGVYQFYYLLVHVNLFGGGYGAQTASTLRQVLAV